MELQETRVDDLAFRWWESGSGAPVVLIHGIPTSPTLWRRVVPEIEAARCLAWEMVGYGSSIPEGRHRHISVSRQADHLLAWLQAIDIESAILVGHDLGGGVAQIAAARRPEVCGGLVLVNSIAYDSWPIAAVRALRSLGPLVRRLPTGAFEAVFRRFVRSGHDDPDLGRQSAELHWQDYAAHGGAAPFLHQAECLHTQDTLAVAEALPRLDVPARVVWGEADPFQAVEYGERLARDLRCPLRRIPGARHFVPEDHPQRVADAVNELLATPLEEARPRQAARR